MPASSSAGWAYTAGAGVNRQTIAAKSTIDCLKKPFTVMSEITPFMSRPP
jgi:hypothetical protein